MLQLADGFDSHATGTPTLADGDAGWGAQSGMSIVAAAGKFAGKALRRAAATAGTLAFSNPGAQKGFAGYFKLGTFGGSATAQLLRMSGGQVLLATNQVRDFLVYDGGNNLRITAAAARTAGAFDWIEVDFLADGIYLYVNGLPAGSYVGAYTAVGDTFALGGLAPTNTPQTDFDDFITWDADGSYFNSFPVGPRRIHLLRPDGAGNSTQWTPNAGANWEAADADDWAGGDGVAAEAAGLKDLYSMSDLANLPASVDAVVVKTRVQNTGDNPAQLLHTLRSADGTEANSSLLPVPTAAPGVLKSVFYRDPNGAPWTAATVNGLQAGQTSSN